MRTSSKILAKGCRLAEAGWRFDYRQRVFSYAVKPSHEMFWQVDGIRSRHDQLSSDPQESPQEAIW